MQLHPARVRPSIRLLKLPAGGLPVPPGGGAAAASGFESPPGPALQDRTAGGPKSSVMYSYWCVLEDGLRFESQAQLQLRGCASDSGPAGCQGSGPRR
jgi:hypothetical protein